MSTAPVRRPRGRAGVLAAASLGVCLVLAACGEDAPEPAPLESPVASEEPSESPEPSAEPSAGPPEMPEAAKGTSKKSAEAFVRYVVDVLNYTSRTLDTRPLQMVASKACEGCRSLTSYANDIRADGGTVSGGEWEVDEVFVVGPALTGERHLLVKVVILADAQRVQESEGGRTIRYPAGRTSVDITVAPAPQGAWQIAELRQVGS